MWVDECFFWYRPTRVVPDQGPLNGCVCVRVRACVRACVCVCVCVSMLHVRLSLAGRICRLGCANKVAAFIAPFTKNLAYATNILGSLILFGPTGGALQQGQNLHSGKNIKMLRGRLVHVCTALTDLQIWAVNCTKMRLAARLYPDPLGEL